MPPRIKSIKELRQELAARERQLRKLVTQRRKLAGRLQSLDRQIVAIGGEVPAEGGKPPRRRKAVTGRRGIRRGRTGKPLVEYIRKVLASKPKGMRVAEIAAAVLKAGYEPKSKRFYRVVAGAVRQGNFRRVGRGIYRLRGRKG